MRLIPNWRRAWRMFSVQAQATATAILGGWAALPEKWQDQMPAWVPVTLACVVLVFGIVGRLVEQPKTRG